MWQLENNFYCVLHTDTLQDFLVSKQSKFFFPKPGLKGKIGSDLSKWHDLYIGKRYFQIILRWGPPQASLVSAVS